nr:MAG TPA: hypothetical protein [Caudoviricetes sp.]
MRHKEKASISAPLFCFMGKFGSRRTGNVFHDVARLTMQRFTDAGKNFRC